MNTKHGFRLLGITILIIVIIMGDPLSRQATAQGNVNLRLPFDGTHRLTAYVDHRSPNYTYDGNVLVYNGEERLNCANWGDTWTNQGPYCYDGHNATDYSLYREPVLAAASGKVTFRDWRSNDYGNSIRIDHGNGYETWYSHLESFSVALNSDVVAGQQIGISGNTGLNQPYHLHFEVHHNGNVTDPFGWRGSGQDPLAESAVCPWGDGQCTAIVIEDESDWFYKYGTGWDWDCHGNGWTLRRVANKNTSETAYARWRPDLPYAGPYAVYAFVPAVHATTRNAEYVINDRSGDHSVRIIQDDFSDQWVYLGSYDFWDSIINYIYLDNATGEANSSTEVCFDSEKFQQFRVYLPAVLNT
jgi:murein DD-endopeptidase MepM/ murein hydrolase activator NlpD